MCVLWGSLHSDSIEEGNKFYWKTNITFITMARKIIIHNKLIPSLCLFRWCHYNIRKLTLVGYYNIRCLSGGRFLIGFVPVRCFSPVSKCLNDASILISWHSSRDTDIALFHFPDDLPRASSGPKRGPRTPFCKPLVWRGDKQEYIYARSHSCIIAY